MSNQKYTLQSNEAVIMKTENVRRDDGFKNYVYELILTNKNLILVKKGNWRGKVLDVFYFPISSIRSYEGKASIILSKEKFSPKMEIHFMTGEEAITFEKRKEAEKWVENINNLLSGEEIESGSNDNNIIPGTGLVAETLKGTIDTFKGIFNGESPSAAKTVKKEKTVKKCTSCGASNSGISGRIVRCEYCGSEQLL